MDKEISSSTPSNDETMGLETSRVINRIAEQVAAKLGIIPLTPKEAVEERMKCLNRIFATLGKPDAEVMARLREQALALMDE